MHLLGHLLPSVVSCSAFLKPLRSSASPLSIYPSIMHLYLSDALSTFGSACFAVKNEPFHLSSWISCDSVKPKIRLLRGRNYHRFDLQRLIKAHYRNPHLPDSVTHCQLNHLIVVSDAVCLCDSSKLLTSWRAPLLPARHGNLNPSFESSH